MWPIVDTACNPIHTKYDYTIPTTKLQQRVDGRWPGCLVHGFYVAEGEVVPSVPAALDEAMTSARRSFQDEPTQNKVVDLSFESQVL